MVLIDRVAAFLVRDYVTELLELARSGGLSALLASHCEYEGAASSIFPPIHQKDQIDAGHISCQRLDPVHTFHVKRVA